VERWLGTMVGGAAAAAVVAAGWFAPSTAAAALAAAPLALLGAGWAFDRARAAERARDEALASLGPWADGALAAAVLDPALLVDAAGVVVAANPAAAALFGRDPVGATTVDLVPDGFGGPPLDAGRDHAVGGLVVGTTFARTAHTRLGHRPVEVVVSPATERRCVWVLRPGVTAADPAIAAERDRLAAELAAARDELRARSAFVAGLSHELRTPLNAILGYTELVLDELGPEHHGLRRELDAVLVAARHLLALVTSVLELSRLEAGKGQSVALDLVAVGALVAEVESTTRPLAERNGNTFTVEVEPGVTLVRADALHLRQILINLVGNAGKFTRGGRVALTVGYRAGEGPVGAVVFEVSDTGIGMSPEQLGRLFKDWVQADPTIRKAYGGTGLGLALSRRMAEAMGGTVSARSEAGKGSTFTLSLPWSASTQRTLVPDLLGSASVLAGGVRAPLAVVDARSAAARDRLEAVLTAEGLGPVVFTSSREPGALAVLRPRAVLVEDDPALVRRLVAADAFARVPVLTTHEPDSAPDERVGWLPTPVEAREVRVVLHRLERRMLGALVPPGTALDGAAGALSARGWRVARTPTDGHRYALVLASGDDGPAADGPLVRVGAGGVAPVEDPGAFADLLEAAALAGTPGQP
jgi:signal transduction histidine kinase